MTAKSTLRMLTASSLALAGLTVALPGLCPAQSDQPQYLRVTTYRIKPDMVQEWESLIKNEILPAYKKAGVSEISSWDTANFGNGSEYTIAIPVAKFGDLDGPSPLSKALAPDALANLLSRARKCVIESRSVAVRSHPELSLMHEMTEPPNIAMVTTTHVAPGHRADFENFLKNDVVPAYKKVDVQQYWVYETVFGGDSNEFTSLLLFKKYADFDAGPLLVKAVGQEGYEKLMGKTAGIVASTQRTLLHYRADLSAQGGN
jgi:hypothetical protein